MKTIQRYYQGLLIGKPGIVFVILIGLIACGVLSSMMARLIFCSSLLMVFCGWWKYVNVDFEKKEIVEIVSLFGFATVWKSTLRMAEVKSLKVVRAGTTVSSGVGPTAGQSYDSIRCQLDFFKGNSRQPVVSIQRLDKSELIEIKQRLVQV